MSTALPTVLTAAGLQPQSPSVLNAQLITLVSSTNPGYTANLPGSLIEDISSTDTGALVIIDSIRVELVNSLSPFVCNEFILNQLGTGIYGVPLGLGFNTSVFLVFSGTPGYVIQKGFTCTDGTFQYVVQTQSVVGAGGSSAPVFAVAIQTGTWPVPANSVTNFVTAVPNTITLSVTNPTPGIPSSGAQTPTDYRAQVLQAGLASSTGVTRFLKTILGNVPGTQQNLISVRPQLGGGWEVLVGGGADPYAVVNAIYMSGLDFSGLVGSVTGITGITKANPGVVTTDIYHGLTTGQSNVHIAGVVGMTAANGGPYTVTVIDNNNFSFGVDTTGFSTYISGGVVTPNTRNQVVTINDYPDTYDIPYVAAPVQTATMAVTWDTTSTNLVSNDAIQAQAGPALAAYVSGLAVGQPINVLQLETTFLTAIAGILTPDLVSVLTFAVSINGFAVAVTMGTKLVVGDPESSFTCSPPGVSIAQA